MIGRSFYVCETSASTTMAYRRWFYHFFLWGAIYVGNKTRFTTLDKEFDPKYGDTPGTREKYFESTFPGRDQIRAYLSNATILKSSPRPSGNAVFHFDREGKLSVWRDNAIETGRWSLSFEVQILQLGDRRRFALAQIFCFELEALTMDNGFIVRELDGILSDLRKREYREGNVFNLAGDRAAPIHLPSGSLTIDGLQNLINKQATGR